jgi:hypothetical protein
MYIWIVILDFVYEMTVLVELLLSFSVIPVECLDSFFLNMPTALHPRVHFS